MEYLYLALHLITVSFPLARSFERRIYYFGKWKALFPAITLVAAFFLIWDVIFTRGGVWGFNSDYLLGIHAFHLPVEEWLFFFTVPFASVFIYECVVYFIPYLTTNRALRACTGLMGIAILAIAISNSDRAYTFWNFLFAGTCLTFSAWQNPSWMAHFWVAYLLHLLPFFLVNGVLTGAFTEEPVVWYNDDQNLGIRLVSIPIEDTLYTLLLLLMNIYLYERFKSAFGFQTISPANEPIHSKNS